MTDITAGVVTSVSPLRVRPSGETADVPALGPATAVEPGDTVALLQVGTQTLMLVVDIRDYVAARIRQTETQTIDSTAHSTQTVITMGAQDYAVEVDVELAQDRIVIARPGIYAVTAAMRGNFPNGGEVRVNVEINGAIRSIAPWIAHSGNSNYPVTWEGELEVGDAVRLTGSQNGAGSASTSTALGSSWLALHRVSVRP